MMDRALVNIWAKTAADSDGGWHPLVLHMLDVAAAGEEVLTREPESTRDRMAAILGLPWSEVRAWLLTLVACHDLGKACSGFQAKWPRLMEATGLRSPPEPNTSINHGFVSQVALAKLLREKGWPDEVADYSSDAVGCHHGERASYGALERVEYDRRALGEADWARARCTLFEAVLLVFGPASAPSGRPPVGRPAAHRLAHAPDRRVPP